MKQDKGSIWYVYGGEEEVAVYVDGVFEDFVSQGELHFYEGRYPDHEFHRTFGDGFDFSEVVPSTVELDSNLGMIPVKLVDVLSFCGNIDGW